MTDSIPVPILHSDQPAPRDLVLAEPQLASLERYVEERMLGKGAMGVVHLVRDRETGERLALKKLGTARARCASSASSARSWT